MSFWKRLFGSSDRGSKASWETVARFGTPLMDVHAKQLEDVFGPLSGNDQLPFGSRRSIIAVTDLAESACQWDVLTLYMLEDRPTFLYKTPTLRPEMCERLSAGAATKGTVLDVNLFEDRTYPVLSLKLEIRTDAEPAFLEAVPEWRNVDVAGALDALLEGKTGRVFILANDPLETVAHGDISLSSPDTLRSCLDRAARCISRIPESRVDHAGAVQRYFEATSLRG